MTLLDAFDGASQARVGDVAARRRATRVESGGAECSPRPPRTERPPRSIEMALLDRELRTTGTAIVELWPTRSDDASPEHRLGARRRRMDGEPDDGRVRVKTAPGPVSERALEQLARLRVPVLLDFNCSASATRTYSPGRGHQRRGDAGRSRAALRAWATSSITRDWPHVSSRSEPRRERALNARPHPDRPLRRRRR